MARLKISEARRSLEGKTRSGERGRPARCVTRRRGTLVGSFSARRRKERARRPRSPASTNRLRRNSVTAQKFCRAHSPFSLQLHFSKRERASPCSDDEFLSAPQNFSRFSAEIDN